MEIKLNNDTNQATELYKEIANTWNIILDFIDINTTFQIELCSKFFRERLLFYYESKESLLKKIISEEKKPLNQLNEKEKKEYIINFKKNFLSKYFNLLVNIDINDNKFGNEENKDNDFNNIIKKPFIKLESMFYKRNKIMIGQILIQENHIFILYNDNAFSLMDFNINDNSKKFKEIFNYDFLGDIIDNFKYYEKEEEKIIFFMKKNSDEFFYLNLNEKEEEINIKKIELKKEFEIFKEENINLKEIFPLNDFLLFLTNKDEFILIPYKMFKIFKQQKSDENNINININNKISESDSEKNSENSESNDDNIPENKNQPNISNNTSYPQKLENNYGTIKYINSNNKNVIFINNVFQIYSIPSSEIKNYKNKIPKFKIFSEQKFPNFYTMGFSDNSFLLLEKKRIKPLEEWTTKEIYNWFEEMELDDYLNIIKYKNITGKNIVKGG